MLMSTIVFYGCLGFSALIALLMLLLLWRSHFFLTPASKDATLCDLLDYATLAEENVIVLKSGGLLALYEIRLPDLLVMPDNKIEHIYDLCQKALLKLVGNYCVQVDLVRNQDYGYLPFITPNASKTTLFSSLSSYHHAQGSAADTSELNGAQTVLERFEQERAKIFAAQGSFTSHLYLSITYIGVNQTSKQIEKLLASEKDKNLDALSQTRQLINEFKHACQNVIDTLELCFKVTPLGLQDFVPPNSIHHRHGAQPLLAMGRAPEENTTTTNGTTAAANAVTTAASATSVAPADTASATNPAALEASNTAVTATTAASDSSASVAPAVPSSSASARVDHAATAVPVASSTLTAPMGVKADAQELDPEANISPLTQLKWRQCTQGHWNYHRGLSFIHQCLTGKRHAIATPTTRCYLDAILATEDFQHSYTPQIGSQYIAAIAIEGLPTRTHEGLLNTLGSLPFTYRFNTRFIYFDTLKSSLLLDKYRRYWIQKSKGLLAQIFNLEHARLNQNAVDQVAQLDQAKRALDNNEVIFGSYTATLILMDDNLLTLRQKAKQAIQAIEDIGLSARIETVNATEAFLGSLPGHYYENIRRPIVSQDVLLDLLPLSVPDSGDMLSPNPLYGPQASPLMQVRTTGLSNFYLNLHEQDLGNSLIIGPSGSGKSVLLGELMLNLLRYPGMRIFAFDKGYSFYGLTKALQGNHITFDNSQAALCPLESLQSDLDIDYACSYVEMLLRLNGVEVQPAERNEIVDCLKILRNRPDAKRTLSDLHILLAARHLKEALAPYTKLRSPHGLLDCDHNMVFNSTLTTFECADIFQASSSFALPVLKQIFHLIAQQFDGRPVAIVLDEAWLMLQDPAFALELITWFKTLRKFNAIVILATQSLTDLQQSPHFINLLECAKTRFYLPNYDAATPILRPLYQSLGLEDKEIDLIAGMIPKKDYYFAKNEQHIRFNLVLSPAELALLSLAGNKDKALVDQLYPQYGSSFYEHLSASKIAPANISNTISNTTNTSTITTNTTNASSNNTTTKPNTADSDPASHEPAA